MNRKNANPVAAADLELVAAVARHGGARAAALRLGLHLATVYRRLQRIEAAIGGPLFERDGSAVTPTGRGEIVLQGARAVEGELADLRRRIAGTAETLQGPVRITTADTLAPIVCRALDDLRAAHPAIIVALSVSNTFADLARHEADLAIRPTRSPPETLIGRRAAAFDYAVYAAPGRAPDHWIGLDESLAATPAARWLEKHAPADQVVMRVNSIALAAEAAVAGLGKALLPSYLAAALPLARIADPVRALRSDIWILMHADLRRSARMKTLSDFFAKRIGARVAALNGP